MARVTRIALDIALFSLKRLHPAVSSLWGAAKKAVAKTPAKPLISNPIINKLEHGLDRITTMLVSGVTTLRNNQLPREERYLEKELDKVRQRMSNVSPTSKALRPGLGCAWQYAKTEVAPPMTVGFLHGPGGKSLENSVAAGVDGFIAGLEQKITNIKQEEIRAKKAKEGAIKEAQDKAKAAAKAKEDEKKKIDKIKQKEIEKAAKAKADAQAKEEAKKAAQKPKEPPKKEKEKKAPKAEKKKKPDKK